MTKRNQNKLQIKRTSLTNDYTSTPTSDKPIESAPILNKLLSTNKDDIAWSAAAISNLVSHTDTLNLLLSNNVIGHLSSAMTAPNPEIQTELIGALRNITIYACQETSKEMYHKTVVTNLMHLIPNVNNRRIIVLYTFL